MGAFIYNLNLFLMRVGLRLASTFHKKAHQIIQGQKHWRAKIKSDLSENSAPIFWFHCASLGEYEQGKPVMEAVLTNYPEHKVLVTFFSPSGYEIRHNEPPAHYTYYLPFDTKRNAQDFIEMVNPVMAFFVKYEFWYHYLKTLSQSNIPTIYFSSLFRPDQLFFKNYASFYTHMLHLPTHFFVQDQASIELLNSVGVMDVSFSGDTRFDRVETTRKSNQALPIIEQFKKTSLLCVVGSSWPEDIEVLAPVINRFSEVKFIIASHEISEADLSNIERVLTRSHIRYSQYDGTAEIDVLLIDNIGLLSKIYRYADFAWIGGGYKQGLHNILEPATFGIPVLFGDKKLRKYPEAQQLINAEGGYAVKDSQELSHYMLDLILPTEKRLAIGDNTRSFVEKNLGATQKIIYYVQKSLA